MRRRLGRLYRLLEALVAAPILFLRGVAASAPAAFAARRFAHRHPRQDGAAAVAASPPGRNPLRAYFESHTEGRGIWKWTHYFEAYHRHLSRFVGKPVNVVEIGVFSGGSLEMWRTYFGPTSHIYGVDIDDACRKYESEHVSVFIGDQEDRAFWRRFHDQVPNLDVVIDDGGHLPEQQQVSLEELLPRLRPGGVYICEDVSGVRNRFAAFAAGLVAELNRFALAPGPELASEVSPFQAAVHSIHFYPFMVVIEKHDAPPAGFRAPQRGTEWLEG
jgi:23S rRNA U2552 (ribose-2'-O)-methylase RlmE/FtsJ